MSNGYALSNPSTGVWTYRSVTSDMTLSAGETFYTDPSLFPASARSYLLAMAGSNQVYQVTPQSYTVATAPSASANTNTIITITDLPEGSRNCYSDGANWRRVSDDTIVV